jgi:hypothetical protein
LVISELSCETDEHSGSTDDNDAGAVRRPTTGTGPGAIAITLRHGHVDDGGSAQTHQATAVQLRQLVAVPPNNSKGGNQSAIRF